MHHRKRYNVREEICLQQKHDMEPFVSSSLSRHDIEVASGTKVTISTFDTLGKPGERSNRDSLLSPFCITYTNAGFYVLSGCSQPLIMTLLKEAGIADPSCQSYMVRSQIHSILVGGVLFGA
jgi:hypothetical protein